MIKNPNFEENAAYIADKLKIGRDCGAEILARIPEWWAFGPTGLILEARQVWRDLEHERFGGGR